MARYLCVGVGVGVDVVCVVLCCVVSWCGVLCYVGVALWLCCMLW